MGSKNQQYNQWLKDQKKYGKKNTGDFESYRKNVSGGGKVKLSTDYTNWWDVAGDIYGGVAGQRAYAVLKEANPGIDRFYRGMTINVPRIDKTRVRLTDEQVAKERKQWDYQASAPTQEYFSARNEIYNQGGQPVQAQGQGTGTFPSPLYEGQDFPQALSPSVIELSTGAKVYAPYPWQNATPGGAVGSMGGIRPTIAPLQDFFYGTNTAPRRTVGQPQQSDRRITPRQSAQGQRAQPTQTAPTGQGTQGLGRRFEQSQYGAQFGGRQLRPPDTATRLDRVDRYGNTTDPQALAYQDYGTRPGQPAPGFNYVSATGSRLVEEVANNPQWQFRDHTWLEPWMKQNLPSGQFGGTPTDAEIAQLPEEVQEMLFVLGIVEPTPFSTGTANNQDFSRGTGYTPIYRGGGFGGSGRSRGGGGGGYAQATYPRGGGGGSRDYTSLVKWNI
jgi:hypothetical protein